ncbi:MAG TPA: hypothetical protein VJ183_12720 [Chloroflexia bacterium]|nr:hypothetical protein [Chloroflexia bacterium]
MPVGRRTTDDGRRTTDDGRWTTDDGRRTIDDNLIQCSHALRITHYTVVRRPSSVVGP